MKKAEESKNKISLEEALKRKPPLVAISRKIEGDANLDEYINYALVSPPEGYEFKDYDIRHVTLDNVQLVFFFERKRKASLRG